MSRPLDPGQVGLTQRDLPPHDQGRLGAEYFFPGCGAAPFELEIGSGKGTFLLQEAPLQPETNFLGIEYAGEFYKYAADRIRRAGVPNVRLLYGHAVELVTHWMADACCRTIHLYFSDPWPKTRHHKRRIVQDATLVQFHRILQPHGQLRLVTDHAALWEWYLEHTQRNAQLFAVEQYERPKGAAPGEVVGSNFERKYRREGRPFHAMTLIRI